MPTAAAACNNNNSNNKIEFCPGCCCLCCCSRYDWSLNCTKLKRRKPATRLCRWAWEESQAVAADSGSNGEEQGAEGARACALMGRISYSLSLSLAVLGFAHFCCMLTIRSVRSVSSLLVSCPLSPSSSFPRACFSGSFVLFCSFAWHLFNPQLPVWSACLTFASVAGRCMGRFIVISTPAVVVVVAVRVICISHTERRGREWGKGRRDIPRAGKCALAMETTKKAPEVCLSLPRLRLRFVEPLKSLIENILSVFLYVILWRCRWAEKKSREQGEEDRSIYRFFYVLARRICLSLMAPFTMWFLMEYSDAYVDEECTPIGIGIVLNKALPVASA